MNVRVEPRFEQMHINAKKVMRDVNTLYVGMFNSVEPTINARVDLRFKPTHLKRKGTNEGSEQIGHRKIQFCRTYYNRTSKAQTILINALKAQRN